MWRAWRLVKLWWISAERVSLINWGQFVTSDLTAKNGFAKIQIGGWKMKRLKFSLKNKNKIIRVFK